MTPPAGPKVGEIQAVHSLTIAIYVTTDAHWN
jgi:hypothetical protein